MGWRLLMPPCHAGTSPWTGGRSRCVGLERKAILALMEQTSPSGNRLQKRRAWKADLELLVIEAPDEYSGY